MLSYNAVFALALQMIISDDKAQLGQFIPDPARCWIGESPAWLLQIVHVASTPSACLCMCALQTVISDAEAKLGLFRDPHPAGLVNPMLDCCTMCH